LAGALGSPFIRFQGLVSTNRTNPTEAAPEAAPYPPLLRRLGFSCDGRNTLPVGADDRRPRRRAGLAHLRGGIGASAVADVSRAGSSQGLADPDPPRTWPIRDQGNAATALTSSPLAQGLAAGIGLGLGWPAPWRAAARRPGPGLLIWLAGLACWSGLLTWPGRSVSAGPWLRRPQSGIGARGSTSRGSPPIGSWSPGSWSRGQRGPRGQSQGLA
jgi:hypothetical protein